MGFNRFEDINLALIAKGFVRKELPFCQVGGCKVQSQIKLAYSTSNNQNLMDLKEHRGCQDSVTKRCMQIGGFR